MNRHQCRRDRRSTVRIDRFFYNKYKKYIRLTRNVNDTGGHAMIVTFLTIQQQRDRLDSCYFFRPTVIDLFIFVKTKTFILISNTVQLTEGNDETRTLIEHSE